MLRVGLKELLKLQVKQIYKPHMYNSVYIFIWGQDYKHLICSD
jgi:hypothetical protein